jgi:release factor glutamine methyltransferase
VKLQKKILNLLHPLLRPVIQWYLSATRIYKWKNIRVKTYPGVFHPGFFFSTKILLQYLSHQPVSKLRVLELGAGTGLISICLAQRGAIVTASDINPQAIAGLHENFLFNKAEGKIIQSDLFDNLNITDFDLIVINPPYYPKKPIHVEDHAWYCGENFEYFQRLFKQIAACQELPSFQMILSADCNIDHIDLLAKNEGLTLSAVYRKKVMGEENSIFTIKAL